MNHHLSIIQMAISCYCRSETQFKINLLVEIRPFQISEIQYRICRKQGALREDLFLEVCFIYKNL